GGLAGPAGRRAKNARREPRRWQGRRTPARETSMPRGGPSRPEGRRGSLGPHRSAEAQGAHVGPDLLDVGKALVLRARFAGLVPPAGNLALGRPEGVLALVVD